MYPSPNGNRIKRPTRARAIIIAAAAAVAVLTIAQPARAQDTITTSPAPAHEHAEPWPSFTGQPEPSPLPIYYTRAVFLDNTAPPVVSAPLPPAVWSGAAVLAGNFLIGHLWKRRKA